MSRKPLRQVIAEDISPEKAQLFKRLLGLGEFTVGHARDTLQRLVKSPVLNCQKLRDGTLLGAQVDCLAAVGRRFECHFDPHGVSHPLIGDISCLLALTELAQQDEGM